MDPKLPQLSATESLPAGLDVDLDPINVAMAPLRSQYPYSYSAAAQLAQFYTLDPTERRFAAGANSARMQAFASGRLAARMALRATGMFDAVVLSDADGVPVFPAGYAGSISHKHGRAVAVVVRGGHMNGVGIDLEFDSSDDERSVREAAIVPEEERQLAALLEAEPGLRSPGTLFLSAKEAVYKAVFPLLRTKFSFEDVQIRFVAGDRAFTAVLFPGCDRLAVAGRYGLASHWLVCIASALPRNFGV